MSFMYNPYPYDDPLAVNRIALDPRVTNTVYAGLAQTTALLKDAAMEVLQKKRTCILCLDGYISAPLSDLSEAISDALKKDGISVSTLFTSSLYHDEATLDELLVEHLPTDTVLDPPLLYGKLFEGGYEALMDNSLVDEAVETIKTFKTSKEGVLLISGNGALIGVLRALADLKVYADVTQKRTVLNFKAGSCTNLGYTSKRAYKPTLRHAYYVDFEVASKLRGQLLAAQQIDYYLSCDKLEAVQGMDFATYLAICQTLVRYPLRCRPVYLEGIWGGFYVKHLRNLPSQMKNCAWVFDLIPLEVSIVVQSGSLEVEFPFYGFVQTVGVPLMGETCTKKFDGYFPIRFNYDDTFHASGNMSIQCHPDSAYVKAQNNELGRQDESYYIVVAGQEAKTYCGFTQDCDVEEFIALCKQAETTGEGFDYDRYVYSEPSKPGMQFLIPSGTIHASGRNQVILEIGSLTVGSYTYKMYDYLRKDLDGNLRPIHTIHGDVVLKRERKRDWVKQNLIQEQRLVRSSTEGTEVIVGEHELLYFTLRNLFFTTRYTDQTVDRFHVLVLVEGEEVMIRSLTDPDKYFIQHYLDMVVVPASFGPYEMVNLGVGNIVMHKTMLRDGYEQIER